MAKGVELASAYVSLSVSTENIPGQIKKALNGSTKDIEQAGTRIGTSYSNAIGRSATSGMLGHGKSAAAKFGDGFQSDAERRGARIGTAVGTVIGKGIGGAITLALTGATAGLTAAVGGISYSLFKGFERYKSLDASAKRLRAMGKTGEQVKTIMGDVNEVVEGTPISLDAATEAATKFVTAGMEGKKLKKTLTAIADAAGASGSDFGELATIFGQVENKGKLMGEEISQLAEHGLNVMPLLKQQFKDLPDDIGDAGLKLEDLVDVVEGKFGGMAKSAADTVDGAIGQMQTSVARVGANFLSAIFGDPLDTSEGPGGMAEAINKVTAKIDGLNDWVKSHQGEIKQFFTDASETVKGLWNNLKEVGTWMVDNKGTIAFIATAFAGWKVASLIGDLGKVSGLLGSVGAGGKGGSGILGQLGAAALITGQLQGGGTSGLGALATVGGGALLGAQLGGPVGAGIGAAGGAAVATGQALANDHGNFANQFNQLDLVPGPKGPSGPMPPGYAPNNPLDAITGQGGATKGPLVGGAASQGSPAAIVSSPREFAHSVMMPYWQKQGFTVGDHEADKFGEHQNGALDIMVPNLEAGQRILQQVLQDPNVYGAIFNNQAYGYGQGMTARPYSGGNTGDPTQDHMNHVHVWYKPQGMATGGGVSGPGGVDNVPAWLSAGEHVLTTRDVAAMGGQAGVYAFRNALHRNTGGEILPGVPWQPDFLKFHYLNKGIVGADSNFNYNDISRGGAFNPNIRLDTSTTTLSGFSRSWLDMMERFQNEAGRGASGWWQKSLWFGQDRNKWVPWPDSNPFNRGLGFAEGGAVDPNLLLQAIAGGDQHGSAQGLPIGPNGPLIGEANIAAPQQQQDQQGLPARTEGYIPAGAGFSGKTGGGLAGGLIALGGEAAKGAIQMAADLGKMAASAAAAGASGGAGAAAGPAAGAGIQIAADIAKRGVDWGVDMANIGIGALSEIFMPFGAPRWLSDVDATSFMPNLGGGSIFNTAAEQMAQGMGPGQADPMNPQHGQALGAPPGPGPVPPGQLPPPPIANAGSAPQSPVPSVNAQTGEAAPGGAPAPAAPPANPNDPANVLRNLGIFDTGGVLQPNSGAINLSRRPEYVFTQRQFDAMEANAAYGGQGNVTYQVYGNNLDEALRELKKHERRQSGPIMRGKAGR